MKTAFMFSGQGSQYAGMGKEFYENFPICKQIFDYADEALGMSISKLCFEGGEDLDKTEFTQPAVLTVGICAYKLMQEKNIVPDYVLGLSLGEYSALVASGAMNFKETVSLVRKRGRFMTEACPEGVGVMSAIMNLSREAVLEACEEASYLGVVTPANYNMPAQIVIAGEVEAVKKAEELALQKGAKRCMRLKVSGAFHTKLLESASIKLNNELKNITINDMNIPVVTNLTGDFIKSKDDIVPTLTEQVMSSVMWEDSIVRLINLGVDNFIELGCGKTLSSFVKKIANSIDKEVKVSNVEDLKSFEAV